MRQALHIFRKDARHLQAELWLSLAFTGLFVYAQLAADMLRGNRAYIVANLLVGFWAFVCARLIQAEPIPGDRQFWITRPYDWRSLLGAKLLFVVVFIGIPLLAADAVILARDGFSVASHAPGLPGVGLCRFLVDDMFNAVECKSPLREPSRLLDMRVGEERWGQFVAGVSYSPLPADSSILPLKWYVHSGRADFAPATLTSLEPLAHFRRDLDLPNVYLADFHGSPRF